jgi:hypothetical protein
LILLQSVMLALFLLAIMVHLYTYTYTRKNSMLCCNQTFLDCESTNSVKTSNFVISMYYKFNSSKWLVISWFLCYCKTLSQFQVKLTDINNVPPTCLQTMSDDHLKVYWVYWTHQHNIGTWCFVYYIWWSLL